MRSSAKPAVLLLTLILLAMAGAGFWRKWHSRPANSSTAPSDEPKLNRFSERALSLTYLADPVAKPSPYRTGCDSCHPTSKILPQREWGFLIKRSALNQRSWAEAIPLQARCGLCHPAPHPALLPRQSWAEAIDRMQSISQLRKIAALDYRTLEDIRHFYFTFSPERLPVLPPEPDPAESPLRFQPSVFGAPKNIDSRDRPLLGHVQIADLNRDGKPGVLVCDTGKSAVTWIHRSNGTWREQTLAAIPHPVHTQIVTNTATAALDIVVAGEKIIPPTDDPVGIVTLLVNDGQTRFHPITILENISRVADVEPGDFNGDGKTDFVVAAFGFINEGEIGWLENQSVSSTGTNRIYQYHPIVKRAGAIHVLPIDLDKDGRLDFVALFAQEHERISAFINDGHGGFQERVLFQAATPSYGSSGIQLADLNNDGEIDILYTNGDNMDLSTMIPRPSHGIQWLENKGNLNFVWHDVYRLYGAYCAIAGDLNHDGKTDIIATSMFNDWNDPHRASLMWFENDGHQHFIPHTIAIEPIHLISADLGDLDGNGSLDIVACGMHAFPPFPVERMGRVTLWRPQPAHH